MKFSTEWRWIFSPPASGSWNMAVDEMLLQSAPNPRSRPTLRLYSWNIPCLSLGYAQPYTDVDPARLQQRGWSLVRRPTGGRAILHTDELTYSIITSPEEPFMAGGVLESYRRIAGGLLAFLQSMGVNADSHQTASVDPISPQAVCFEVPSNYEITCNGKKIIGSAQARKQGGILQHGAIPLEGDISRITEVLFYPSESERDLARGRVLERAATIQEITGKIYSIADAARLLTAAFEDHFGIHLLPGNLTPQEIAQARKIEQEKYLSPVWTRRL